MDLSTPAVMDLSTPDQIVDSIKTGLLPRLTGQLRCAVLYGSRAVLEARERPDADVDLFFVTTRSANPITVVEEVVSFFANEGLTCDPFWYVDTYFFETLDAGIDCTLWHQVFDLGRVVYAEAPLMERVNAALQNTPPIDSFRRTIAARRNREVDHVRSLIRNADRILTESMLLAYCRATGITTWDAMPRHTRLASFAFEAGAIDEDIRLTSETLARLKAEAKAGAVRTLLEQLAGVQDRLRRFADEQLR